MFCFSKLFAVSSYFLSWCFLSCTGSHLGSCSCCPSAGSHTSFQHVLGSTVNSFWTYNSHTTEVVGPLIEVQWSLYTRHSAQVAYVLLISIFCSQEAKWSGCYCILVFPVSLSNAHHRSERRGLDRTESFGNPDFVHYIHHHTHYLHTLNCQGQLVPEYLLLVVDDKKVLDQ